ncbi:toprim domain-containing protein [Campylobacter upsaliensis]|nr:DNA primase [Campylobacter upsaliensis]EAJ7108461.1 DNA primase [Campylobacter upsaliensis]EAK0965931.1 DNA primase [Campylobacter upsaliensis]EAL3916507.1 DNA primase [Campylobacter upsaliensis]EAL3923257.1 DNA primase [Campylobacter upsaliensis]
MPRIRKYLNVPFKDKDEAKSLGAIWDKNAKKYFVPYYLDFTPFIKWNENAPKQNYINHNEALIQFKHALEAFGLILETYPIMNGKIQRCKTKEDKGNEKSGAYLGYLDEYPAGFMQNFKTGIKENWKFRLEKDYRSSKTEKSYSTINSQKQVQKEQELLNLQEKTALRLQKEWNEAKKALNSHLYLKNKGINNAYDLRVDRFNNLLIPLRDIKGKLWSLQRISESGRKIIGVIKTKEEKEVEYLARKKGCFYTQVSLEKQNEFLICEGFATAISLQEYLNKAVIMAIDAGNLISVIEVLKLNYPFTPIILYADNDLKNINNVGLNTAKAIKEKYEDIKVFYPNLDESEAKEGLSDFNDIVMRYGAKMIKEKMSELK